MTLEVTFRPIDGWPGQLTPPDERLSSPFTAGYSDTLELLERELDHLGARNVVVQLALDAGQIRVTDGMPRSGARPDHPGVILAFDSRHGPLKYATDRYHRTPWRSSSVGWQANLRAIALGLEALRRVDRYGITSRGEQYTGWAQLPPGQPMPATHMTVDEAASFLAEHSEFEAFDLDSGHPDRVKRAYVQAARRLHPDAGGDEAAFVRLQAARDLLTRGAS